VDEALGFLVFQVKAHILPFYHTKKDSTILGIEKAASCLAAF
jgi:hypothetical protein